MKVRINNGKLHSTYCWFCLGCKDVHQIDDTWHFNNNRDKPTFSPSILVQYRHPVGYTNDNPAPLGYDGDYEVDVCHSFVTDGKVKYLEDSTHELSGQTVNMPDVPAWLH